MCIQLCIPSPALHVIGLVMYACSLGTGEVEAEWSQVLDYPGLKRKFETSFGYLRLCFIDKTNKYTNK